MIGSCPTWVITTPVFERKDGVDEDDYLNFYEDHDYSGTWPQWLDSLLMPGRWLDLGGLVCLADDFDIAVFVVSAVHGELVVYHLGKVEREDGRLILLTLAHDHWGNISRREGYDWPHWWFTIKATDPSVDTLLGGMLRSRHALVDASTAALQLVGGADVAADDDEMAGSVSK
jgi:SAM-dependent methyltransferase